VSLVDRFPALFLPRCCRSSNSSRTIEKTLVFNGFLENNSFQLDGRKPALVFFGAGSECYHAIQESIVAEPAAFHDAGRRTDLRLSRWSVWKGRLCGSRLLPWQVRDCFPSPGDIAGAIRTDAIEPCTVGSFRYCVSTVPATCTISVAERDVAWLMRITHIPKYSMTAKYSAFLDVDVDHAEFASPRNSGGPAGSSTTNWSKNASLYKGALRVRGPTHLKARPPIKLAR
jgi:hypothetical protein